MRTKRKQNNVTRSDGRSKKKKHASRLRKLASASQLSRLRHHLGWCHWCGHAIIRTKMVNRLARQGKIRLVKTKIKGQPTELVYHVPLANNAGAFLARIATTDHVLPITHGGRNGKDNLVDSCKECNCARGVIANPKNQSPPFTNDSCAPTISHLG